MVCLKMSPIAKVIYYSDRDEGTSCMWQIVAAIPSSGASPCQTPVLDVGHTAPDGLSILSCHHTHTAVLIHSFRITISHELRALSSSLPMVWTSQMPL